MYKYLLVENPIHLVFVKKQMPLKCSNGSKMPIPNATGALCWRSKKPVLDV